VATATLHPVVAPLPRGTHPHEVKVRPRPSPIGLAAKHPGDTEGEYPYSDLISEGVDFCYDKLVQDPSCCIDEKYASGVTRRVLDRPSARWECGAGCFDSPKGLRGQDNLWVPDGATCTSPRLLFIHGGSWWYGSPNAMGYAQLGSRLAAMTGAVVMLLDYPLIPAGNYSTILPACIEAMQWLAVNGPAECGLGVNAPLLVGGDSSGGGTALSMVLKLKMQPGLLPGGQSLAGAFFWSPWTNLQCNTAEYYHHAFARIVATRHSKANGSGDAFVGDIIFQGHPMQNLDWFTANAEGYVGGDHTLLRDPIASPFHATEVELAGGGIPPLYFAVGGSESILGDSVVVAQKAAAHGVDAHLEVYTGMWHVFPMYTEGCGLGKKLWPASRALEQTTAFLRHVSSAWAQRGRPGLRPSFWTGRVGVPASLSAEAYSADAAGRAVRVQEVLPHTVLYYDMTDTRPEMKMLSVAQTMELQNVIVAATTAGNEETQVGGSLLPCGTFVLGFVVALALQYVARWSCSSAPAHGALLSPLLSCSAGDCSEVRMSA